MGSKLHTFSSGCRRARKKAGYTQQSFADAIHFSVESVRNWEQGRVVPERSTIEKLCDFFKCDMDYLFDRIDYETHDLSFICKYTGLSEEAVKVLHYLSADNAPNVINNASDENKLPIRYINRELGAIYAAYKEKIDACDCENLYLIHTIFGCMEKYVTSKNARRVLSHEELRIANDEKSADGYKRYLSRIDFAERSVKVAGSVDEILTVGELYSEYLMNSIRNGLDFYRKLYEDEKSGHIKEE